MKKVILLFLILFQLKISYAQPQKVNYQAVAMNASGIPVKNKAISVRLNIVDSSANGTVLYTETHSPTTDGYGQFSIYLGGGTPVFNSFSNIVWQNGRNKFLKVESDISGQNNFTLMGISEIVSVPFSFHSNSTNLIADSVGNLYKISLINGVPSLVSNTPNVVPNLPKAILFAESVDGLQGTGPDSTDLLAYMLANANYWYGFQLSGLPRIADTNDVKTWMDWPGFKNGTPISPAAKFSEIPQTSGGIDNYGNFKQQYKFNTIEIPANTIRGNGFFVVLVPKNGINNTLSPSRVVGISYFGSPNSLTAINANTPISFFYNGNNYPKGVYYVLSNPGGNGFNYGVPNNFNSNSYFFKGQ